MRLILFKGIKIHSLIMFLKKGLRGKKQIQESTEYVTES